MPKVAQPLQEPDAVLEAPTVKEPWPLKDVIAAVEARFPERSGKLVCRFLWERNGVARYRANWIVGDIGETVFPYSSFLLVRHEHDGFVVEDGSNVERNRLVSKN